MNNNENMNKEVVNEEVVNNEEAINEEAAAENEATEEITEVAQKKKMSKGAKAALIIGITVASLALVAGLTIGGWYIYNYYMPDSSTDNESEYTVYTEELYTEYEDAENSDTTTQSTLSGGSNSNSNGQSSQNNSSADKNNNSSKAQTTTSTDKSSETKTSSNKSLAPAVTLSAQVANGVCIVGGSCSKDTEYITISGDKVQQTTVVPFEGGSQNYFMTQVKYSGPTTLQVTAKEADKEVSNVAKRTIGYANMSNNYMTEGEYNAVVGKGSRMHYYSALLSYSLSADRLTSDMCSVARSNISKIVSAAKDVNAKTIFYIIPSSADIYPETVPDGYKEASGKRIYELFSDIATECGATVIYPLETMKSHANDGVGYQIYQYTDSHWSTYGAYWGTYDLFQHIAKDFPAAKPRTVSEMGFYTAELYGGDAFFNFPKNIGFENSVDDGVTRVTGIKELTTLYSFKMPTSTLKKVYHGNTALYLTADNEPSAHFVNPNGAGLPKAVIMRDSFSKVAYDMINDRFSEIYWGTFNNYNFPETEIYTGDPDYVIYFYSERNLLKVMLENKYANILTIQ